VGDDVMADRCESGELAHAGTKLFGSPQYLVSSVFAKLLDVFRILDTVGGFKEIGQGVVGYKTAVSVEVEYSLGLGQRGIDLYRQVVEGDFLQDVRYGANRGHTAGRAGEFVPAAPDVIVDIVAQFACYRILVDVADEC